MAAAKKTQAKKAANKATVRIQYIRSAIGFNVLQKKTILGLGFRKLNATVELEDTPAIRGMIAKVPHLVRVVE